ncbi:hypothetical protein F5B19DRAFT_388062 [Rostrohypoxylon terebratum]|nr:hypothetical protein F5B19DRAFT_388062 [Rostrohypoxylon terebratum]
MSSTSRLWRQQLRFLTTTFPSTRRALPRPSNTTTPTPTSNILHPRAPRSQRFQSSKPPNPSPSPSPETRKTARAHTILTHASRFVPKRLYPYLHRLRTAPFSHVAAFLVLHELTAILPLFGLAYLFHSTDWVPTSWVLGPWAAWAEEGLRRYMRYFRKNGWFGLSGEEDGGRDGEERLEERLRGEIEREKEEGRGWFGRWRGGKDTDDASDDGKLGGAEESKTKTAWKKVKNVVTTENTEKGYKIGIQIAAAYAITKMLLIPRIALSLWATPWLARGFVAARRSIWKKSS